MIISLCIALFGGCGIKAGDGQNSSDEVRVFKSTAPQIMFDKIITALDNGDKNVLKELFSRNALSKSPDIDEEIDELFELYQGKFVSNSHFNSGASTGHQQWGIWVYLFINPTIKELKTDKAIYTLRFYAVSANDEDPNDIGLCGIWLELKDGENTVDECKVGITNE